MTRIRAFFNAGTLSARAVAGTFLVLLACWCRGDDAERLAQLERRLSSSSMPAEFLEYTALCLAAGQPDRGSEWLAKFVETEVASRPLSTLRRTRLERIGTATDGAMLLQAWSRRLGARPLGRAVAAWLLADSGRLGVLLENLRTDDVWPAVFRILETLHNHDPAGCNPYFDLMLAIALVWDQNRPPPHHQMGPQVPTPERNVTAVYTYFRNLYAGRAARMAYRYLDVGALIFVVDVPVPLAELQWARNNLRGNASNWDSKFEDIEYDMNRLASGRIVWPHGPYTLAAIRELGGICTDQAYYATMTARAFGIPAMLFVGRGRRGGHAWFGYMASARKWELDAGRYVRDKYATGVALNPQTARRMTDHELLYTRDRALQSPRYSTAARYTRIARLLNDRGAQNDAWECAMLARKQVALYDESWQLQESMLLGADKLDMCLDLLAQKATVFHKYPDVVTGVRSRQAEILRRTGRATQAERLLRLNENRLGRERDDLAQDLAVEQVNNALQRGDPAAARKKLEDLIKDQKREGMKAVELVHAYLQLTRQTGQQKEALRFLKRVLPALHRSAEGGGIHGPVFMQFLVQAYENAGDTRGAERVRRKLGR